MKGVQVQYTRCRWCNSDSLALVAYGWTFCCPPSSFCHNIQQNSRTEIMKSFSSFSWQEVKYYDYVAAQSTFSASYRPRGITILILILI